MKSAGNEGVVQSRLQVLHVHVFFAAPLGARPVSYTHLDVYKRQVLSCAKIQGQNCGKNAQGDPRSGE